MAIYKIKRHESGYSQISNGIISNPELSAKAKGIMIYLISKPPDWEVRMSDILNHMTDGETSIRSGLKELEIAGYILRDVERDDESGKIKEWVWNVYETPLPENKRSNPESRKFTRDKKQNPRGVALPDGGNPHVDNPDVDNHHPTNKESTNIERTNKELKDLKDGDKSPSANPSEDYREHLRDKFPEIAMGIPIVQKLNDVLDNLYDYPAHIQDTIMAFSRKWRIPPPPKDSSDYSKWCKDATDIYKKCKNAQLTPEEVINEAYYIWKTPPKFLDVPRDLYEGNYSVYDMGSVSKLVWIAISNILSGQRQRRVKVYTDANGKEIEIEQ